jgi:hypothetical protein
VHASTYRDSVPTRSYYGESAEMKNGRCPKHASIDRGQRLTTHICLIVSCEPLTPVTATPCERLLRHPDTAEKVKVRLLGIRDQLDPLELLHRIRQAQAALANLASPASPTEGPGKTTLGQFLAALPSLWKTGEARPTHRKTITRIRYWRTRTDPFESVWLDVLQWLQRQPDSTAKELFQRLRVEHPGRFSGGQLRTLQRRMREWRHLMAKQLVYHDRGQRLTTHICLIVSCEPLTPVTSVKISIARRIVSFEHHEGDQNFTTGDRSKERVLICP